MSPKYLILFFLVIAFTSCTAPTFSDEAELFENEVTSNVTVTLTADEEALFELVNAHRESLGLNALEFNAESYEYALEHNQYMISKEKLSHDNFSSRAAKISKITAANFVAENVAKGFDSLEGALNGWLQSTPHRNTIEGDFTHATLCITKNAEGQPYYTQIFFRK